MPKARRKSYGHIYARVYTGQKSVDINFKTTDRNDVLKLARLLIQAIEDGRKNIDITAFIARPKSSDKKVQVTVTGL